MRFILSRIGLLLYGFASLLESVLNIILYLTFLDKVVNVFDFSIPFHFWYSDKYLKAGFLRDVRGKTKERIDG